MRNWTDTDLYARGVETFLASWEEYARGTVDGRLERLAGVSIGIFTSEPERSIYNNALLERELSVSRRAEALDALEAAYSQAGVTDYAAWVHESDQSMCAELSRRGQTLRETTRMMGMSLEELEPASSEGELRRSDIAEHVRLLGLPPRLLSGVDPDAFDVLVADLGGESVATGISYDHGGDCGVFNVSTNSQSRRRGIGTALTAQLLLDAVKRGCSTASLQSTPMAESVYAAVGFRDLGRFLEYGPRPG